MSVFAVYPRKNETRMNWDDIKIFLAPMRSGNIRAHAEGGGRRR
jgi:hypothetical protein